MGHVHVKLDYDPIKQAYLLKRGGTIAKRLSEGEKTAIAFAHFIASLQQQEFNKSESIVVIDDPISSLDATACYFIYGLVKALEKEVNQLFLMTHSHSFFVLLMRHFRGKTYGHYEVHRFTKPGSDIGYSKIMEMEERKTKYYTEYNYLFSQIHTAANEIKAGTSFEFDRLYNLMNCSRKLLEAFLGFKYPHDLGDLEKKWKKASDDHSIDTALQNATFRVINFGSHSGVDGFLAGSGLESSEMAECVSLVLDFVQAIDSNHYDGMVLCENDDSPPVKKAANAA
jgi:wobble nucleotide-excising tRNase